VTNVKAVRAGLSGTPTYTGTSKAGGAQYPGMWEDGSGNLWISYDTQKETVWVTKIPISSL
jgi:hypothetical protein